MALVVTVELLTGSYDAAEVDDREQAEWPPHPARLFCALVAAARGEADREVLRWLEAQPAPAVVAAWQPWESQRASYVVANTLSVKRGSQTHPGRTNGLWARTRAFPAHPTVTMIWPSLTVPSLTVPDAVQALDRMARRIPYLGRSTGIALVAASAADGESLVVNPRPSEQAAGRGPGKAAGALDSGGIGGDENAAGRRPGAAQPGYGGLPPGSEPPIEAEHGRELFEPCDLLEAEVSLRVPYPGLLEELDVQFEAGRPAWEVSRYRGYRRRPRLSGSGGASAERDAGNAVEHDDSEAADRLVPSVYSDVLVFQFSGLRPQARLTARLTEAFRSAVLRAAGGDAPRVLHGHGADGRPHVAFLALPDVGAKHADGHLLGLAVAVPELPDAERKAVLRAVLGLRDPELNGVIGLRVPDLGLVEVIYQPGLVRPWGASPQRWRRGSCRWVSATPVVLDRHPKGLERVEAEVRASLRTVGLPEPVELQVSTEPLLPGAARLRPGDLPRTARNRLFRHVAVTFGRRVSGPVLVGAGRYLGVGLMAPVAVRGDSAVRGDDA